MAATSERTGRRSWTTTTRRLLGAELDLSGSMTATSQRVESY